MENIGKKKMDRKLEIYFENTYKCSCGHSVVIFYPHTKRLCTWCNHYVYKDKKEEFTDKLRSLLRKRCEMNELPI